MNARESESGESGLIVDRKRKWLIRNGEINTELDPAIVSIH